MFTSRWNTAIVMCTTIHHQHHTMRHGTAKSLTRIRISTSTWCTRTRTIRTRTTDIDVAFTRRSSERREADRHARRPTSRATCATSTSALRTSAASPSVNAASAQIDAREDRHLQLRAGNRRCRYRANSACNANHSARFRITPTTAAVIAASAPASGLLMAQRFDVRRAEEDPQETRHERGPQRDAGGDHAAGHSVCLITRRRTRRTARPGSTDPAWFRRARDRRASARSSASRSRRPHVARHRRAPHTRRRTSPRPFRRRTSRPARRGVADPSHGAATAIGRTTAAATSRACATRDPAPGVARCNAASSITGMGASARPAPCPPPPKPARPLRVQE